MAKLDFLALLMFRLIRDVYAVVRSHPIDHRAFWHRNDLLDSVRREHSELLAKIRAQREGLHAARD